MKKNSLDSLQIDNLIELNTQEIQGHNGGSADRGGWYEVAFAIGATAHTLYNYFKAGPLSSEASGLPAYR